MDETAPTDAPSLAGRGPGLRSVASLLVLGTALLATPFPGVGEETCIACRADRSAVLAPYDEATREALRGGAIRTAWVEPDADGRGVRAAMIVDAPPERVWSVLTAWERWPDFVPRLQELEVRSASEPVRLRHRVQVVGMDVRYGTVRTLEPAAGRIEARLDPQQENDLETNRTVWQLVPLDDGARTFVEVQARLRTGWTLPGFVEEMLLDETLPDQMRAFRRAIVPPEQKGDEAAGG
ncbi:MAG: SRPBCC family protein [Myxococcota bacterium]|nr:SRPBCC family protein [Myxococcota bacterium]